MSAQHEIELPELDVTAADKRKTNRTLDAIEPANMQHAYDSLHCRERQLRAALTELAAARETNRELHRRLQKSERTSIRAMPRFARWLWSYCKRKTGELEFTQNELAAVKESAGVAFQITMCCACLKQKHTPVRNDNLGGYICGGCLENAYESTEARAKELESVLQRFIDDGYNREFAIEALAKGAA